MDLCLDAGEYGDFAFFRAVVWENGQFVCILAEAGGNIDGIRGDSERSPRLCDEERVGEYGRAWRAMNGGLRIV